MVHYVTPNGTNFPAVVMAPILEDGQANLLILSGSIEEQPDIPQDLGTPPAAYTWHPKD